MMIGIANTKTPDGVILATNMSLDLLQIAYAQYLHSLTQNLSFKDAIWTTDLIAGGFRITVMVPLKHEEA